MQDLESPLNFCISIVLLLIKNEPNGFFKQKQTETKL